MSKNIILFLGLIFCGFVMADDSSQAPATPSANAPAAPSSAATQISPNITIVPSAKDEVSTKQLFQDATYDNFAAQPEKPFVDPANLNRPE